MKSDRKTRILALIESGEFKDIYDKEGSQGLATFFQITCKQLYPYLKYANIPYRHSKNKIEYPSKNKIKEAIVSFEKDIDAAGSLGISDSFMYALRKLYTADISKFKSLYELSEYSGVSISLICRDFSDDLPLGEKPKRNIEWPEQLTDVTLTDLYLNKRRGYNSIAKEYNIPHRKVLVKLKELGIYQDLNHRPEKNEDWLRSQIESGKILLQIGAENGISDSTIGVYARKFNIPYDKSNCIWQDRIAEFIKSLGVQIQQNDRKIIGPLEIDIWCPDFSIGIECNGCKWHSDERTTQSRNRHLLKFQKCVEKGVRLYQIFDCEFYDEIKWEKWKSLLRHQFLKPQELMARKCSLVEVDRIKADDFHDKWHLQGRTRLSTNSENYGLIYRNELVAVASFDFRFGRFELSRLTFKEGFKIVGGAAKLHSKIEKEVYTLSDNTYSTGVIYQHCGYVLKRNVRPSYFYASHAFPYSKVNKRKYRNKDFAKDLNIDPKLTEFENMANSKYYKVWDAGYKLWVRSPK